MQTDLFLFVKNIVTSFKTRDPYILCRENDIAIGYTGLPKQIRGFSLATKSGKAIMLNNALDADTQATTVARLLAHCLLHGDTAYFESNAENAGSGEKAEAVQFASILLKKHK